LLSSLSDEQWAAETAAPGWSVKDLSLHLLDVDLSWLSRERDRDHSGDIEVSATHGEFVNGLADRNERWVAGARSLSHELIIGLLGWAGEELTRYLDGVDLGAGSSVYWAGDAPMWFDMAREFTERWVHGRQIREAALGEQGAANLEEDQYLDLVIRTFIWGYPHQYKAEAPAGTVVAIEVEGVGGWTLTARDDCWDLDEASVVDPVSSLTMTADAAWRLLTGAEYEESQVRIAGRADLAELLTKVRGIIV
jgi:hypothetical protein